MKARRKKITRAQLQGLQGMGSIGAMRAGSKDRYFQSVKETGGGLRARAYRGSVQFGATHGQASGGIDYCGAPDIRP